MKVLKRFQSFEGEYFQYRKPAKFISEILLVLSSVVGVGSVGVLVAVGFELDQPGKIFDQDGRSYKDVQLALFIYTIVILMVCVSDIIFALLLYSGTQKVKLSYCLFWRGATVTSLVITGMITLAFVTMVRDLIVVLGYLPSLISKPFCLWVVNGFILELRELSTLPCNTVGPSAHPPVKPTFSLGDLENMKRTTTIFDMKQGRKSNNTTSYIATAKLKSVQE